MKKILSTLLAVGMLIMLFPASSVRAETLQIAALTLPSATVGQAYSYQLQATGGTGSYTSWAITDSSHFITSNLCCMLSVNSNGLFSGTLPSNTATGSFYYTFKVTDSAGNTATKTLTLIVNSSPLQITTTSLPEATIGQSYSAQLQATGGAGVYTWTPISTTYPSACCVLGISGEGPIFNTQTSATVIGPAGDYLWTVKVTDSAGGTAQKTISLRIKSAVSESYSILTDTKLPDGTVGQSYAYGIEYTSNNTYSLNSNFNSLPPGLRTGVGSDTLNNYGMTPALSGGKGTVYISGTPTTPGTYTIYLNINNPNWSGSGVSGASKQFTLTVKPANPAPYFLINTNQLSAATVGKYYTNKIDFQYITNGTNYASNATFSGLPPGITTDSTSGQNTAYGIIYNNPGSVTISGTPTAAGTYTVTVSLTDQNSANLTKQFILTVNSPSSPAPAPQPVSGSTHADYTNVAAPDGTVYRIENGTRYPYTSAGAFLSYGFNTWGAVVPATTGDMALPVATYRPSGSTQQTTYFIPPRNGSLINDKGTIYLITNGTRVGFANAQSFLELGYSFSNAQPGDTSFMVTLAPSSKMA
jgi:hypothetical protein